MLKFYTCEECKTVKTEEEVKGLDISKLTEVIPNTTDILYSVSMEQPIAPFLYSNLIRFTYIYS